MGEQTLKLFVANATHLVTALVGLALLIAALHLLERAVSGFVAHRLGWRIILVTAWLGVPLHELGHLGMAWVFGHRIVGWRLFQPDPVSGTLGYVRHAHARRTMWQLIGYLFIGIAPVLSGGLALMLLLWWMTTTGDVTQMVAHAAALGPLAWPSPTADRSAYAAAAARFSLSLVTLIWHRRSPWLPLQLYLAICVASHLAPSRSDLLSVGRGALVFATALVAVAGGCAWGNLSLSAVPVILAPASALVLTVGLCDLCYVAGVGAWTKVAST